VIGARVWTPRPSEEGPILAWMVRDLLEARSGELGEFELAGLPPWPATLRVEAAGLALHRVDVRPPGEGETVNLGDLYLDSGSSLRLVAASAPTGALARVDPGLRNLPLDLLTAPLEEGAVTIEHVPPGSARVSVADGGRILCEQLVEVPGGGETLVVECAARPMTVSGLIEVGGAAAGPGKLVWSPLGEDEVIVPEVALTYSSGGLRQFHSVAAHRPVVDVEVGDDGLFASDQLWPGDWDVTWLPDDGIWREPKRVELPRVERYSVAFRYEGVHLHGVVVDREGRPVAGALVRELNGRASAISGPDGGFSLGVAGDGPFALRARHREVLSSVVEVVVEPGREPDAVELVLGDEERADGLAVRLLDDGGEPVAGAVALIELAGHGLRVLTSDATGAVRTPLPLPRPDRFRVALQHGGCWTLGAWTAIGVTPEVRVETEPANCGQLVVSSRQASGEASIVSSDGWDVGLLMRWQGVPPLVSPQLPFEVDGLPAGSYRVAVGERSATVSLRRGDREYVELP